MFGHWGAIKRHKQGGRVSVRLGRNAHAMRLMFAGMLTDDGVGIGAVLRRTFARCAVYEI